MAEKVFLVIGAGAGIGGHAAMRFAQGGYHAVLARRSDEAGLAKLVDAIEEAGGKASGTLLDAAADGTIEELVERVERDIGGCAAFQRAAGQHLDRLQPVLDPGLVAQLAALLLRVGQIVAPAAPGVEHPHAFARGLVEQLGGKGEAARPFGNRFVGFVDQRSPIAPAAGSGDRRTHEAGRYEGAGLVQSWSALMR